MATQNTRQANPIGLDFSGDGIRAAQVETIGDVPRLVDMAGDPKRAAGEESLRSQVSHLLSQKQFVGTQIATSIPSEALSIHHIRLPVTPQQRLDAAVREQLAPRLDYEIDQAVVRRVEIASTGGRDGHVDHVVMSVPRHVVELHLRMAERLGLTVVGISALPLAAGHAFSYLGQRREESGYTFLLVHLEARVTHLVIMHEGNLRFARTIPQGVHDILDAVAAETGRDTATLKDEQEFRMKRHENHVLLDSRMTEAPEVPRHAGPVPYEKAGQILADYSEEIVSCMCYFASTINSVGVNKVIFTGLMANDYDFCQVLAHRLGLPAQIGDPLAGVRVPVSETSSEASSRVPQPEMTVAIGLTLFGALVN